MENSNELELLSINRASKLMHISRDSLRNLINEGKIGVILIGKHNKIPKSELYKFQEANLIKQERRPILSKATFNSKLAAPENIGSMLETIMSRSYN